MLYDISLRIAYSYDHPADSSRHVIRLAPADLPGEQRQIAGTLTVEPKPNEWRVQTDFFGNKTAEFAYFDSHKKIALSMHSRVERKVLERQPNSDLAFQQLENEIFDFRSVDALAPHHFTGFSPRVAIDAATTRYAREQVVGLTSVLECIIAIGQALRRDFLYDPKATTVETPLLEAFNGRRGVCQDFSHIMIACLRGLGIPAGYVSGYLRTIPPPGKKRLEGADAMHAWVRAWCGNALGWIEYDPTNTSLVASDHIAIARGRDYSDVAPIKGILRTHGKHTSTQKVDVIPVAT
jgi:transglutaminase-like putative cysteine protease